MKRSEFTEMREIVRKADHNNFIWYAGQLWMDLTDRQCLELLTCGNPVILKEGKTYLIPSGFTFTVR